VLVGAVTSVMDLAELGAVTALNLSLLLQTPLPAAFLARTFQVRLMFLGSALLLFHERLVMLVFLRSSWRPW